MSNHKQYNSKDSYFNIDRQDKRIRLNMSDDDLSEDMNQDEIPLSELNKHLYHLDKFKLYPSFLKKLFKELATKYAAIKCIIMTTVKKQNEINEATTNGILPKQFHHQQKLLNRFSDVETIRLLTMEFLKAEQTLLQTKLSTSNQELANRHIELAHLMEPLISHTKIINVEELQTEITLDTLIEQEFCIMLTKMEQDKVKKALKKEKLLIHKEKSNEIATITTKEFDKLKKELKQLKINNKNSSKNAKGTPILKKVGQSQKSKGNKSKQQAKQGNKSKNSKSNGNTKNTVAKRQ